MIYESPDGGQTVYERHPGKPGRKLIKYKELPEWHMDVKDFNDMMGHADDFPALKEQLVQLKTLWALCKKE